MEQQWLTVCRSRLSTGQRVNYTRLRVVARRRQARKSGASSLFLLHAAVQTIDKNREGGVHFLISTSTLRHLDKYRAALPEIGGKEKKNDASKGKAPVVTACVGGRLASFPRFISWSTHRGRMWTRIEKK